jgi:hypothetical protein
MGLRRLRSDRTLGDVAGPPSPSPTLPAPSPVLEALTRAPLDDKPYTDEERAADDEAREDIRRGHVVTTAELRRPIGF